MLTGTHRFRTPELRVRFSPCPPDFRDAGKPGNPPVLGTGDRTFKLSHPDQIYSRSELCNTSILLLEALTTTVRSFIGGCGFVPAAEPKICTATFGRMTLTISRFKAANYGAHSAGSASRRVQRSNGILGFGSSRSIANWRTTRRFDESAFNSEAVKKWKRINEKPGKPDPAVTWPSRRGFSLGDKLKLALGL